MPVQTDGIGDGLAVGASGDDAPRPRPRTQPTPRRRRGPAAGWPRRRRILGPLDPDLSLAVVARRGRLENQGKPERRTARRARSRFAHGRQGASGSRVPGEEALFPEPVLADPDGTPARADRRAAGQPAESGGRDVLELDGDAPRPGRRRSARPARWSGGATMTDQWATCAAGRRRRSASTTGGITHPLRGLDEHPAELAAADNAERRRRVRSRRRGRRGSFAATPRRPGLRLADSRPGRRGSGVEPRQDRRGQQRRHSPRRGADRQGPDGDALGHLDDRQERIDAAEDLALDRDAEDRQDRDRREHARQMGCASGAGDQHLQAASLGVAGVRDRAGRGCGAPRRPGPRGGCRARRAPRSRAASSPSRTGSPSPRRPAAGLDSIGSIRTSLRDRPGRPRSAAHRAVAESYAPTRATPGRCLCVTAPAWDCPGWSRTGWRGLAGFVLDAARATRPTAVPRLPAVIVGIDFRIAARTAAVDRYPPSGASRPPARFPSVSPHFRHRSSGARLMVVDRGPDSRGHAGIHADRAARRHRDHRRPDRPLLLPAVQSAREAARRTQCLNNSEATRVGGPQLSHEVTTSCPGRRHLPRRRLRDLLPARRTVATAGAGTRAGRSRCCPTWSSSRFQCLQLQPQRRRAARTTLWASARLACLLCPSDDRRGPRPAAQGGEQLPRQPWRSGRRSELDAGRSSRTSPITPRPGGAGTPISAYFGFKASPRRPDLAPRCSARSSWA